MDVVNAVLKYRDRLTNQELYIIELALRSDLDIDDPGLCEKLIPEVDRILQKIDLEDRELRKSLEDLRKWLELCVKCGKTSLEDPECLDLLDDPYDDLY